MQDYQKEESKEDKKKKTFEEYTVMELKTIIEKAADDPEDDLCLPGGEDFQSKISSHLERFWFDGDGQEPGEINIFDTKEEEKELLGFSWRSAPETWGEANWVMIDSVMDSGASVPIAPPTMLPNVKVEPSEVSKRGQEYTSASKHTVKNLGEQRIEACTEAGYPTECLFQIADVSKPLVSVTALTEKGNRVIFDRAGGVILNLENGQEIPFYRRNGIYVLSMWMKDGDSTFPRP